MKHDDDNEDLLVGYLLGQLSVSEQERIEQAYIADADLQERLAVVEDELIDDYVGGRLAATERAAFEAHFLNSPRRHERLAFARAWQQLVSALPTALPAEPRPQPAAARRPARRVVIWLLAATVLLAIGSLWLIFETTRLSRELAHSQAERAALAQSEAELRQQVDDERARREALSRQLAESRPELPGPGEPGSDRLSRPLSAVATFMLTAGLARDTDERQTLNLPRTAEHVRLQLLFRENNANRPPDPAANQASYRATLRTPEGREVFSRDGLKAQPKGAARMVVLPAASLAGGDYILTLERRTATNDYEAVAEYAFTVARK